MKSFFIENAENRSINSIMGVMEHVNIHFSLIGGEKRTNCKFNNEFVGKFYKTILGYYCLTFFCATA